MFADFAVDADIVSRLPVGWQEYLISRLVRPRQERDHLVPHPPLSNPLGDKLFEAMPDPGGAGGGNVAVARSSYLDRYDLSRAIVCHDAAAAFPAALDPDLGRELTRASNEWMLEVVLASDERLYGAIQVLTQMPTDAAAEIRHAASNRRWMAVMIGANPLGHPLGHPIYHPIYEAAAEVGFPIILQASSDTSIEVPTYPTAGGMPATYTDLHTLSSQPLVTHLCSLIGRGVFEHWPDLKVLAVGGGVTWVAPFIWRFDSDFKAFRRDAPALTLKPSEYFARNVRVSTYPLEVVRGGPERIQRYLGAEPLLRDVLCYASGYPNRNFSTPGDIEERLPSDWHQRILSGNAEQLFQLPMLDHSRQARLGEGS
jgi:predicted TIM-barrel fold metal-dependent hydrolase